MSKHTRALKQAERDYAKATDKLEKLQIQYESMQKSLNENEQENTEDIADSYTHLTLPTICSV